MNLSNLTYRPSFLNAYISGIFVGIDFTDEENASRLICSSASPIGNSMDCLQTGFLHDCKAQREHFAEHPFYHSPSSDEGNACCFSDSKAQRERFAEYYDFSTANTTIRDEETGFGYFGARYYDSELLTGWLSVDPMSDKYPSLSPYAYCAWNPVKLADPDGREMFPTIADALKVRLNAVELFGESRVGGIFNKGDNEHPNYAFNVFGYGKDKYEKPLTNVGGIWAYRPDKAIDSGSDLFFYANFQADKEWSINVSISAGGQAGINGGLAGLGINLGNVDLLGLNWNLNKGEFDFYTIEDNNARGSRGASIGPVTIGSQSYTGGDYINKNSMTTNFCGAGFGKSAGQWNISVGYATIFGIHLNVSSKIKK